MIHAGEGERLGYGAKVTYACNEGFRLVEQSTRVCQLYGTWNGTQPHCESKCAKFSNCSYLYGVLLSCILLLPSQQSSVSNQRWKQMCPSLPPNSTTT